MQRKKFFLLQNLLATRHQLLLSSTDSHVTQTHSKELNTTQHEELSNIVPPYLGTSIKHSHISCLQHEPSLHTAKQQQAVEYSGQANGVTTRNILTSQHMSIMNLEACFCMRITASYLCSPLLRLRRKGTKLWVVFF